MKLYVHNETKVRLPQKKMASLFEWISDEESDPSSTTTINLIFTDNRRIKKLNSQYRNKNTATDVLSFNLDDLTVDGGTFGEIYISVPFAIKQAGTYNGTVSEELLRLFCHGLLHLVGYDHKKNKDEKIMKTRENYFLDKLFGAQR